MKTELKDVSWKQSYPRVIEGEGLVLRQRTWGRRLIYEVFLEETEESLGTCQVFEKCQCNEQCAICRRKREKTVVKEQVGTPQLIAKLDKIQTLVRVNI